ncbi:hypothetical protein DSM104443_03756 [Usitatibacter rugosus]|uniref:EF-hand domain-containing protein n=1 Tax=Usitatibacter rugosus TaxID=2732067 RepID=A0A6M4H252_9PROT|nr:hypothetical protein [Usitatibacter rugosus]QJR12664.1 hypothetical protein DSM104443_03756 [Usitatibacter rugosus]
MRKQSPATWQSKWNRVGTRVALVASSLAAGVSLAGSDMSSFKAMDANGDGKVSMEEHTAAAKKMFDTMDANHDGKVTAAEMDAAHEQVTGRKAAAGEKTSAEKIRAIDKNNNGELSAGEHEAGSKRMFDVMDTNHDGFLSQAELDKAHAQLLKKK